MQKNLNPIKKSSDIRINHHLSQFKNEFLSPSKKSQPLHSLSEAKPRMNVIKINKGKLPHDFFPKCLSFEKKLPNFKLNLKQHEKQFNIHKPRRVQSQRLHNSPEKTSFFGFFEGQNLVTRQPFGSSSKTISLKRKFQTRQQPKRDNSQMKRRFTPGSNIQRNDLLDLFPASYDQQFTEIITSNSSARMAKLSPRKQYIGKYQQQVYDPEKEDLGQRMGRSEFDGSGFDMINGARLSPQKNVINLKTIEKTYPQTLRQSDRNRQQQSFIQPQTVDLHNMTFFNAKSSCLPPIKKI